MKRLLYMVLLVVLLIGIGMTYAADENQWASLETSAGLSLAETKVGEGIRGYLIARLLLPGSDLRIRTIGLGLLSEMMIETDQVEVREVAQSGSIGRTAFLVRVSRNGKTLMTQWVVTEVAVRRMVGLAASPLKRLQVVGVSDVTFEPMFVSKSLDQYASSAEGLVGKRMTRAVHSGAPLTLDLLEEAPVIKRGDRVTLLVKEEGLVIMTTGIAREEGYLGRQLSVMNLDSKKVVYGEAQDAGTVRVSLK